MGYYLAFVNAEGIIFDGNDLASNSGLASLQDWASGLSAETYPELTYVGEHAETENVEALETELGQALASADVGGPVYHVAKRLLAAVKERPAGTVGLVVTDGTEDDGDEGEEENGSEDGGDGLKTLPWPSARDKSLAGLRAYYSKCMTGSNAHMPGPCPEGGGGTPAADPRAARKEKTKEARKLVRKVEHGWFDLPMAIISGTHEFDTLMQMTDWADSPETLDKIRKEATRLSSMLSVRERSGDAEEEEDRTEAVKVLHSMAVNAGHAAQAMREVEQLRGRKCMDGPNRGKPGPCPDAASGPSAAAPAGQSAVPARASAPAKQSAAPKHAVLQQLLKTPAAAAVGAKQVAARIGQGTFEKLPASVQAGMIRAYKMAKVVEHVAMIGFHKTREVAHQAMLERGASPEVAAKAAKVIGTADVISAWTLNFPVTLAATGSFTAAKVSSWVPVASLAYLGYSTARNPFATLKAAKKVISGHGPRHGKGMSMDEDVLDRLAAGITNGDDWFTALVSVALDVTGGDLRAALDMAEAALSSDPNEPQVKAWHSDLADAEEEHGHCCASCAAGGPCTKGVPSLPRTDLRPGRLERGPPNPEPRDPIEKLRPRPGPHGEGSLGPRR